MFNLFGKQKQKKQTEESVKGSKALWDTDFDDIWSIENKNDFLIAMNGWLCKKSNYGEDIEKLSESEKVFYFVFQLEGEVNNGGFSQFFYNSSGDFANETANALHEIGAYKMEEIYKTAIAALGGAVPKNPDEWEIVLEAAITNEVDEFLSNCDTEFCMYPDNLVELNYQFIIQNKSDFTP